MASPEQIHVGAVIRLTVAATALELATYDLTRIVADLPAGETAGYRETLALVEAALDIARGTRTDVPPELRVRSTLGIMHDTAALGRFLNITREIEP